MFNWYVAAGLALRVLSIVMLAIYVIPIQLQELKRPVRDKYIAYMRWILFGMVILYETQNILPISYQLTRLDTESIFNLRNVSTVSSNIGNIALTTGFVLLYKLADILAKKLKG